jgi:hypothetical protein
MPLMVEKNMLRDIVNLDPGRGGFGIEIVVLFFDFGMIGDDVFVTVKAFFHRRDARKAGTAYIGVAEFALNCLDTGMHPVAEGYRLLRTDVCSRWCVKIEQKEQHQQKGASAK